MNPWGTDEDTSPETETPDVQTTDDVALAFNADGVATNVAVVSLSGRGFTVGTFVKFGGQCMSVGSCNRIKSSISRPLLIPIPVSPSLLSTRNDFAELSDCEWTTVIYFLLGRGYQ